MSNATLEAVVLRSPGECIANVPSLIGFTPYESVVAMWLNEGSLVVTQRADYMDVMNDPADFFTAIEHNGTVTVDEVILIFWTDSRKEREQKVIEYADERWNVRDAMWVTIDRWGSMLCSDPLCCPTEGREIDPCLKAQGLPTPTGSRDDLTVECKPGGSEHMKALDPHGIEGWRDKALDQLLDVWTERGFDSEKHIVRAGRALHDIRVRDTLLWYAMDLNPGELMEAYDFAASVARAMHPDDAAPACAVAAILAWQAGDGARANLACDYALASDSGYSLALLVQAALRSALPPAAWREAMTVLSYNDVRFGTSR